MSAEIPSSLEDYIPKKDTQQSEFLKKYPEYDGRGLLIAIIDHGLADVSLPGMQKTTTGLPKIVDFFDFNWFGRVDTSTVKEADTNNILIGLNGQKLKIPSSWKNPSDKWHVGSKLYHELLSPLTERNREDGTEKRFQNIKQDSKMVNKSSTKLILELKTLDCIVWFDGKKWRACVDTTFSGDLTHTKVLTNYRDEHEYSFIDKNIAYCIKIHEKGNVLEICITSDEHGTNVTHGAAAHFPGEPNKDGLAPGAQILSIAGYRLKPLEFKKALLKCIEMGVNIINFSMRLHPNIRGILNEPEKIYEFFEKHCEKRFFYEFRFSSQELKNAMYEYYKSKNKNCYIFFGF